MFKEHPFVRDKILEILNQLGWEILDIQEANELRDGTSGLVLKPVLTKKLKELNPGIIDSDKKTEEIIKRLKAVRENVSGNEETLSFLRGQKTIYLDREKREVNVRFLDFENPENNLFQAVKELVFLGDKFVRFDIVLFINGVPVGLVETKGPKVEEPIEEAFAQIGRYHREAPEFLKLVQFYGLSEGVSLFYGATWSLIKKNLYQWKGENFEGACQEFFAPKRILSILEDYTIFFRQDEKITKIILKPHQLRAVEKLIQRVKEGKKKHGLIWHTQGSGKTLTMIVAAQKLRKLAPLENPTILVLVDRVELEDQMVRNLEASGFLEIYRAESIQHLQEMLSKDTRGLIVSTIQKFKEAPQNLNNRENIIILVDEAHRSQEGSLGNYLRRALPNAFYFGFTGTPIDKGRVGQGTFVTFGRDDQPQGGYTDKYSIVESIADKTTVPLYYTLAEQDLRVNKKLLEKEFLEVAEKEGVTSIESLNKILEKAVRLREFLKSPQRIKKICQFVARHFQESVEPLGFKAFLVAVDREACALYKKELDNYLPADYSKVVYSQNQRDSNLLRQYYLNESDEKRLKIDFKSPEKLPKIFIVTAKLLTGYDAPILYCMYLDKPMKDHALLQAIARINRPLEDKRVNRKTAGLIVDFVGVFENLKRALSFDSKTIEGAVTNISQLKQLFAEEMGKMSPYIELAIKAEQEKSIDRIIEYFTPKKKRRDFIRSFKKIQDLYEIISPDKFLGPYLEDYNGLVSLYKILINAFGREEVDKKLLRKTKELVRKYTKATGFQTIPVYIIDEHILERVRKEKTSDKVKVIGVVKSITIYIDKNKTEQPYLIPLGELVEALLEKFRTQQIGAKMALEELLKLASNIEESKRIQHGLNLDVTEFTIYWILEQFEVEKENLTDLAKRVAEKIKNHPFWVDNPKEERNLRLKLYSTLEEYEEKMIDIVNKILDTLRRAKYENKN